MARQVWLAAALAGALFAGCIQAPEDVEAAVADTLRMPEASLDAWYAVDAMAGPDAELTAFWWTVPAGGVYKDAFLQEFDVSVIEVALESGGMDPALTEWAVIAFQMDDGSLAPTSAHVATTYSVFENGALGGGAGEKRPEVAPIHLRLWDVDAGDRVGIVVAARAEEELPMRVLLRTLEEDPGYEEEDLAKDAGSFLRARETAPLLLPAHGRAAGLHLAEYMEMNVVFGMPFAFTARTSTVTVEGEVSPDARPFASSRAQTFSTQSDLPGWTMSMAQYLSQGSTGSWWGAADAHGETVEGGGTIVGGGPLHFPLSFLLGQPFIGLLAEGGPGSGIAFTLDVTNVNGATGFELLMLSSVSLGATLPELLGEPAQTGGAAGASRLRELRTPALDALEQARR